MNTPIKLLIETLQESHITYENLDSVTLLVTVPGTKKLYTNVLFKVTDKTLSVNAFVIRKPDQNVEKVHEWLLRHNAAHYLLSYAVNELGDIYLVGRLPVHVLTREEIDRILGQSMNTAMPRLIPFLKWVSPMRFVENGRGGSLVANRSQIWKRLNT